MLLSKIHLAMRVANYLFCFKLLDSASLEKLNTETHISHIKCCEGTVVFRNCELTFSEKILFYKHLHKLTFLFSCVRQICRTAVAKPYILYVLLYLESLHLVRSVDTSKHHKDVSESIGNQRLPPNDTSYAVIRTCYNYCQGLPNVGSALYSDILTTKASIRLKT